MAAHVNGGEGKPRTADPREASRPPLGEVAGRNHAVPALKHAAASRAGSEPTIADLAWTLFERRWTVIAFAAVTLAFAAAYLYVTRPTFQSSVLIQVEGRSRPVTAFQDLAGLFQEQAPTEGEMRIMKSRTLLDAVIDKLQLDLEVRPRTLPVVGGAIARRHDGPAPAPPPVDHLARFAWGGERLSVERLTVSEGLLGEPLTVTALEDGRYRVASRDGSVRGEAKVGAAMTVSDGEKSIELLVSELTARPGTEFTLVKSRRIDVIEELQRGLRIEEQGRNFGRTTGLVEVSLTGHSPALIAATLDAIAETYLRQSIERTSAEAAKTLRVLEGQLPVLKSNVEKAESALNVFQQRHGTVNLSLEGQGMLQRLVEIDRVIAENDVQSTELKQRYADRHPELPVIAEKTQRLHAQRAAMEARLRALPALELESTRLARQLRVATELYMVVHNRAEELRIVKSGWIGNVRVLERAAVPHRPVAPNRTAILALGLLLGLAGGVVVALLRNALDQGARDPLEIEAATGIPVFATIPRSSAQRRLARGRRDGAASALSLARPDDAAVEDLRSLRTSVQFALRRAHNNVVAVSGLAPKAGKSFVSLNLAHLLAAADGRVLLVDADLRRGSLHRHFGLEAQPGLSDVVGGTASLDAAIRTTDTPTLDVLPAGTLPVNPGEVLARETFEHVLAELGRRYSAVVVDTPPILSVADSALVGRHAGMNLLVLRAGEHSVGEISYVLKRLVQNGMAVKGAILNDVRPSMGRYGRSGRHRRYGLDRADRA
jgi:tyrosine-protein kinase Etk/Wzc